MIGYYCAIMFMCFELEMSVGGRVVQFEVD